MRRVSAASQEKIFGTDLEENISAKLWLAPVTTLVSVKDTNIFIQTNFLVHTLNDDNDLSSLLYCLC